MAERVLVEERQELEPEQLRDANLAVERTSPARDVDEREAEVVTGGGRRRRRRQAAEQHSERRELVVVRPREPERRDRPAVR